MSMTPEDLQGHWHRAWLKAPGYQDHDTTVHWMQCGTLYADIRIPANRPELRGATALADLSDGQLLALLRAEGFAGTIALHEDVCTWTRHINWHGKPEAEDAGQIAFDGPDRMVETGIFGDYEELWTRTTDQPARALHLKAESAEAYLVSIGRRFVLGVGWAEAPNSRNMLAELEAGLRSRELWGQFSQVYAFGHWEGEAGVADLCTNPLMEGREILGCNAEGGLVWHAMDFFGRMRDVPLDPLPAVQDNAA